MDFNEWNIIWSLSFGVMAAIAVAGNTITLVIFQKRQLHKRPHFLLISLAVADLLVGLLSIPLYMTLHYDLYEGPVVPATTKWVDMFTGFTSIFTLAVISLERMYAIGWPFRHRALSSQSYIFAIAVPWILAMTTSSMAIILLYVVPKPIMLIILLSVCLSAPILITCTAYFVLWKKKSARLIPRQAQEARDLKLAKTMGLITGAFLVTWLPFEFLILVYNLCNSCQDVSPAIVFIIKLLQFGNSVINIVIYPVKNEEYRAVLVEMVSSYRCLCRRHQVGSSANVGVSIISLASIVDHTPRWASDCQQTSRL